MAKYSVYTHLR